MSKNLLVVGGTGFIGKHLALRAIKKGFNTQILSFNEQPLKNRVEGANYITCDVSNYLELKEKIPQQIEYVVNLSGYIDHSAFKKGGSNIIDTHFGGTQNILKLIDWKNLKRFIQIGSSDEYGNNPAPQKEDMPSKPISPYSFSKSASTELLQMLNRNESFPAVILRFFLVFGPGQDKKRFIPQIIEGCLSNSTFPVSDGDQLRDFCYVENIIDGIFLSMEVDDANGHIINLGSGIPMTIRNVINFIKKDIGLGRPDFGKIPYRPDENMRLYADISKAKKLLGWKEKISFEEGIRNTIDFYKEK